MCYLVAKDVYKRQEYTGCTCNFKTYSKSYKLKKRIPNAIEDMCIFPDTQEAIVSQAQWDRVQEMCIRDSCRHGLLRIVLAPALIRLIQCLGAGFTVGLEADIALRLQKLDHIVAATFDRLHVLSGLT